MKLYLLILLMASVYAGELEVDGNLNVTGISGTGDVGDSTFFIETAINVTGVTGTFAIGTEEAQVNPGFGEGAWNEGTWGN